MSSSVLARGLSSYSWTVEIKASNSACLNLNKGIQELKYYTRALDIAYRLIVALNERSAGLFLSYPTYLAYHTDSFDAR